MKKNRQFSYSLVPRQGDRMVVFAFVFLLLSVAVTIVLKGNSGLALFAWIARLIWPGVHLGFAAWFAISRLKFDKRGWMLLSFVLMVDLAVWYWFGYEMYDDGLWGRRIEESGRSHVLYTLATSVIVVLVFKVGRLAVGPVFRYLRNSVWLQQMTSSRARKMTIGFLCLLVLNWTVQLVPDRWVRDGLTVKIDMVPETFDLWLLWGPLSIVMSTIVIGRLFKRWSVYLLIMTGFLFVVLFLSVEKQSISASSIFRDIFLPGIFIISFFVSFAWLCDYGSSASASMRETRPIPNLFTAGLWASVVGFTVAFFMFIDVPSLMKWHDATRWEIAISVARLNRVESSATTVEYVEEDGDRWFEVHCRLGASARRDCLDNFPNLPGVLTVEGMRTDIDVSRLGETEYELSFGGGAMTVQQLQILAGQPMGRPNSSGWRSSSSPILTDVWLSCEHPGAFVDQALRIIFNATSAKYTSQLLLAVDQAGFRDGFVGIRVKHDFTVEDWERLIKIVEKSVASPRMTFMLTPYSDDLARHRSWFQNVPTRSNTGSIIVTIRKDESDPLMFSKEQLRVILSGDHRLLCWPLGAINSRMQYQAAWDYAFAIRADSKKRISGLGFESAAFTKAMLDSNFRLAWDYHWVFDADHDEKLAEEVRFMVMPVVNNRLLEYVCENFPRLEILALDEFWIDSLGIVAESEDDEWADDITRWQMISKLKNLREFYYGGYYAKDFRWIQGMDKLEHLETRLPFSWETGADETFGFSPSECPNLKTIVLLNIPSVGLMREIAKLPRLEQITIVSFFDDYEEEIAELKKIFDKIQFVSEEVYVPKYPIELINHRKQIRKRVRAKYLD